MPARQSGSGRWTDRTVTIKLWKIIAALVILPILVMWFLVVHQNDEILALVRSDVASSTSGARAWNGSFVNTNSRTLRDVAVTVDFLDSANARVGRTQAEAAELPFGARLHLQAPLPANAARLRIYSVQWRMDATSSDRWFRGISTSALMGPFREPWEFGYLMADPGDFTSSQVLDHQ